MNSTSPALAISTSSGVRVLPTIASRSGIVARPSARLSAGYSRARPVQIAAISSRRRLVRDSRLQASDAAEPLRSAHDDRVAEHRSRSNAK